MEAMQVDMQPEGSDSPEELTYTVDNPTMVKRYFVKNANIVKLFIKIQ